MDQNRGSGHYHRATLWRGRPRHRHRCQSLCRRHRLAPRPPSRSQKRLLRRQIRLQPRPRRPQHWCTATDTRLTPQSPTRRSTGKPQSDGLGDRRNPLVYLCTCEPVDVVAFDMRCWHASYRDSESRRMSTSCHHKNPETAEEEKAARGRAASSQYHRPDDLTYWKRPNKEPKPSNERSMGKRTASTSAPTRRSYRCCTITLGSRPVNMATPVTSVALAKYSSTARPRPQV